jgi:hypothetical protein
MIPNTNYVEVKRIDNRKFDVACAAPGWTHHRLRLDGWCEHCLHELIIEFYGPQTTSKEFETEIKRLVLLEHLRTEHPVKKK